MTGRHALPTRRQMRARRKVLRAAAALLTVALGTGAEQAAVHGWAAFVERPPGVGGTPDNGP